MLLERSPVSGTLGRVDGRTVPWPIRSDPDSNAPGQNALSRDASGPAARAGEAPGQEAPGEDAPVGVVMVNFNTRSITAQAIYSLFRNVPEPAFRLVVVDNASTDGSTAMLEAVAAAGLCEVILNAEQRYHGPGLNQAVDHLAAHPAGVRYVWVLDSDCIVLRPDTLSTAVTLMAASGAGLVGQWTFDAWHDGDMMGLHCLLLDPAQVWRDPVAPFAEHGSPSRDLQRSAMAAGIRAQELAFTRDGYVVHLGRTTLRAVVHDGSRDNRYFDWATTHYEPHFMGEPDSPARYAAFLAEFTADVGDLTPDNLVAACQRHRSMKPRVHEVTGPLSHRFTTRAPTVARTAALEPRASVAEMSVGPTRLAGMEIVLIPGLWLDGSSWDDVVPVLRDAGHRTHALTLPGMESKAADRSTITLRDHIDSVVEVVDSLDPAAGKVVLVGHSGGGAIAHAVVDARPDRVSRVIYVDAFPVGEGGCINDEFPSENGEVPLPDWSLFEAEDLIDLDDKLRAALRERAIPSPVHVTSDKQQLFDERRYDVPATVIACEFTAETVQGWIDAGVPFVRELSKIRDVVYVDLPTGHWPQFTRPAELAQVIVEAVDAT
jgi:pimeloyl-ACP methyl ester carboxylesterase